MTHQSLWHHLKQLETDKARLQELMQELQTANFGADWHAVYENAEINESIDAIPMDKVARDVNYVVNYLVPHFNSKLSEAKAITASMNKSASFISSIYNIEEPVVFKNEVVRISDSSFVHDEDCCPTL